MDYGIAVFRDCEGRAVLYRLCNPVPFDLGTDLKNFKPREFCNIQVMDHDESGAGFYFRPGETVDVTEEAERFLSESRKAVMEGDR